MEFEKQTKKKKKWFSCTLVCLTRESLAVITNNLARVSWRNVDRLKQIYSVQFSSVAQSCLILSNPMNRSTPGLPVHHQLPESTQTHVHWVSDAIQPLSSSVVPFSSCPQSFPSSGSFQMSQFLASGGQSIEFQLQNHSYQWIPRTDLF